MRAVVCIPASAERDLVLALARGILSNTGAELIIVGRGDLLEAGPSRVTVLHPAKELGTGSAYRLAFEHALAAGFDLVLQVDAELLDAPAQLPRLIDALATADVVIASRWAPGGAVEARGCEPSPDPSPGGPAGWPEGPGPREGGSLPRRLLSRAANTYAQRVLGVPYRDSTRGLAGFRRHVLEAVDPRTITAEGPAFQIELEYRAHRLGFQIVELPITAREGGRRRALSLRTVPEVALGVVRLRLSPRPCPQGTVRGPSAGREAAVNGLRGRG